MLYFLKRNMSGRGGGTCDVTGAPPPPKDIMMKKGRTRVNGGQDGEGFGPTPPDEELAEPGGMHTPLWYQPYGLLAGSRGPHNIRPVSQTMKLFQQC